MTRPVDDDLYRRCIARLIEVRAEAGISQAGLATRLGRPQSFVSKYENGERRLDIAEFVAILEQLDRNPVGELRSLLAD
ncbi:MAG: helix-turn-helix transcriptional regulator [Pacificimonas sp.]